MPSLLELLFHLLGRNRSHGSSAELVHDIPKISCSKNNAQILIDTENYFSSEDGS